MQWVSCTQTYIFANALCVWTDALKILARSGCEELESAFIINCILKVQPACVGTMQRLLASCCSPCYGML